MQQIGGTGQRPLTLLWQHRWFSLIITVAVAALVGLFVAFTMPRGPATAGQSLMVMVSSLAVGLFAGWLMRSRWAMLLAPAAYIVAIELARLDAVGPTVDAIRLDNSFGILAFILGRGFHGLVGLLPMILGVEGGVLMARQMSGTAPSSSQMRTIAWWIRRPYSPSSSSPWPSSSLCLPAVCPSRDLALEWFSQLDGPVKRIFTFENAAHAPAFEHFEAFNQIMTETVLPETYPK